LDTLITCKISGTDQRPSKFPKFSPAANSRYTFDGATELVHYIGSEKKTEKMTATKHSQPKHELLAKILCNVKCQCPTEMSAVYFWRWLVTTDHATSHSRQPDHERRTVVSITFPSWVVRYYCKIDDTTTNLVLAMSTGMEAAVVIRPLIMLAMKCSRMFSWKYPTNKDTTLSCQSISAATI